MYSDRLADWSSVSTAESSTFRRRKTMKKQTGKSTGAKAITISAEVNGGVKGDLTTQAQRPGPREAWIATRARWPGSLQRMFRHHRHRGHTL